MNTGLLLSSIAKHVSLSADETAYFLSLLEEKSYRTGEFLIREGTVCRHQFFVCKGSLKTYYLDKEGTDHIIDFLIEGWWADDLYSFLTGTPAELNVRVMEDTDIFQINKNNLQWLYKRVPAFERFFRILFQNAYIAQREQIKWNLAATAEERYHLFLRAKPYAEKRFLQKDIASYLGVTPQFLSVLNKKRRINID